MSSRPAVLSGIIRLARFDATGIACFGASTDAFMTSLAPLVAMTLVGAVLTAINLGVQTAFEGVLVTIVAMLAPTVLSHKFAQAWGREAEWMRYATAFNWSQWALPVVASLWLILVRASMSAGLPDPLAAVVAIGGVLLYALALNWFLVRHALSVSAWRALLVVLVTNFGTAFLVAVVSKLG